MQPQTSKKKPPEPFYERLDLDGIKEFFKAKNLLEKVVWAIVVSLSYFAAVCLPILVVQRYSGGKTVVSRENKPPPDNKVYYPEITLCFNPGWNKTYIERRLVLSDTILETAKKLGLSKSDVIVEFSRYASMYYIMDTNDPSDEIMNLMNEMYNENFKSNHFSDFVVGASFKGVEIFEKCGYNNQKFPCIFAVMALNVASCYWIITGDQVTMTLDDITGKVKRDAEPSLLRYEIRIPTQHMFDDQPASTGLIMYFGNHLGPFASPVMIPLNTHAIVSFNEIKQSLIKDCEAESNRLLDVPLWQNSYENCVCGNLMSEARKICNCSFIGGLYYPKNWEGVCTPKLMKECFRPKVLFPNMFQGGLKVARAKHNCKRQCSDARQYGAITFFNLESTNNGSGKIILSLRPDPEKRFYTEENYLSTMYQMLCDVGGVVGVYTGMSGASFLRVISLLLAAGFAWTLKYCVTKYSSPPIGVLWTKAAAYEYVDAIRARRPREAWVN